MIISWHLLLYVTFTSQVGYYYLATLYISPQDITIHMSVLLRGLPYTGRAIHHRPPILSENGIACIYMGFCFLFSLQ